jgi:hypothetical protein
MCSSCICSNSCQVGDYAAGYASGDMAAHGVGITKEGNINGYLLSTFSKAAAVLGGPDSTKVHAQARSWKSISLSRPICPCAHRTSALRDVCHLWCVLFPGRNRLM